MPTATLMRPYPVGETLKDLTNEPFMLENVSFCDEWHNCHQPTDRIHMIRHQQSLHTYLLLHLNSFENGTIENVFYYKAISQLHAAYPIHSDIQNRFQWRPFTVDLLWPHYCGLKATTNCSQVQAETTHLLVWATLKCLAWHATNNLFKKATLLAFHWSSVYTVNDVTAK